MSTKARLISTISAICLILALLVTGVWAVSTANITLGGTVTFTADNIHATITGSITGTQETVSITPLVYDADTVPSDEDKATWNNNVNFGTGNLITMKVKVKNESSERSLFVKVTDNTTISNIKKEFTSTVDGVGSGDAYEVIKGGEIEYTLTLSVDQLDYSASATYALDVALRDANAPAEEEEETNNVVALDENKYANGITYTLDDGTMTASIAGYDDSCNDNVVIPSQVSYSEQVYNVTAEGFGYDEDEFPTSYFINAMRIVIEEGVTSIGNYAFIGCTELATVVIPETVTEIGDYAFQGCGALLNITLPNGLKTINNGLFYDCVGLTKVIIPAGVTSIGESAFYNCTNLETVVIPETVTEIGNHAFYFANGKFTAYFTGTQEQWNAISIGTGNSMIEDNTICDYVVE